MRRYDFLMAFVCIVGIIYIYRLFNMQVVNGANYREQSEKRLVREIKTIAPRGNIYDRYGKLMVSSETSYNVQLYYTKIEKEVLNENLLLLANILERNGDSYYNNFPINFEEMVFKNSEDSAKSWKKSLKLDEDTNVEGVIEYYKNKYKINQTNMNDVKKIIALRYEIETNGYSSYRPVTLAKNISKTSMLQIEEQSNHLAGMNVVTQPIRKYLAGNVGAHIVGYVGPISSDEYESKKELGYMQNDTIGKTGIEATFEDFLRGENGTKRVEMDSTGIIADEVETVDSIMGNSVVLTIDMDLQAKAEEVLEKYVLKIQNGEFAEKFSDARAGALVVLDVKSSEVLALASYPTYNPDEFTDGISNTEYQNYFQNEDRPMYNRAIQGVYSPGSTFKPLTAIAAIESGAITVKEKIVDKGRYDKGHRPVCWIWSSYRGTHGPVDVATALKVSCNYYFYEVGYRMGIDNLSKYAKLFGLGRKTGVEIIGEAAGTLASKEYLNSLTQIDGKERTWMIGDTLSAAIGQSYNSFTPIQMAYYIATLANGGVKGELSILKDVISVEGESQSGDYVDSIIDKKIAKEKQEYGNLNISKDTLNAVFEGMRSVTGETGGTAYSTFASFPIEVAGKTGTATASTGSANAWFVGFAPYDNPEIAVACVIEHGGHGGYTAPVVKEVMEEYFGYNNDVDEKMTMKSINDLIVE
ncbi:MAG: penicillin-binding protein 2 [Clostridia bacterium]|nr:penicillin-binding protein 2 [Clostridia bacterium]